MTDENLPIATTALQDSQTPERIERFQALTPGQYWRAKRADDDGEHVEAGMVLLIESVDFDQDGKLHTINLRPHPRNLAQRDYHTVQLRYLVAEFLDLFEFEPDARAVRAREMREAQGYVQELQSRLLAAQADPEIMNEEIANLVLLAKKGAGAPAEESGSRTVAPIDSSAVTKIAQAASGSLSDALSLAQTAEGVARMRAVARDQYEVAKARATYLKAATEEIAQAVKALTPYYEEQAAAAIASTSQTRDYVEKLLQGIASLDLYVGKDVEVSQIAKGESAPVGEPLTVMQKKLFADEEAAVFLDIDEWFDFEHLDLFFDTLKRSPGLVAQVCPAPRCVVAMGATRRYISYGNATADVILAERNKATFLLVRDGANLYCVRSPLTSHLESDRLFPTEGEQAGYFQGFAGESIRMDDLRYTNSLKAHDAAALNYKRFLILAAGLDHRLGLFGRFYEEAPSLAFVSIGFQQAHMRFVRDDDDANALAGDMPYPALAQWLEEKNGKAVSGSRIFFAAHQLMDPDTAPGVCKNVGRGYASRISWRYQPRLTNGVAIAFRAGKSLCIKVPVAGETADGLHERAFDALVSLAAYRSGRWHDELAYLVIDDVTPEEIHWFVHHRADRTDHLSYIRFFKEALKFLKAEDDRQAPARAALLRALVDAQLSDAVEGEALVRESITAWRAQHRGADLPAEGSRGWNELRQALFYRIVAVKQEGTSAPECFWSVARIERWAFMQGLTPLRWVLTGAGRNEVYCEVPEAEQNKWLEPHAWVLRIRPRVNKAGTDFLDRPALVVSTILSEASVSESVLHEWPDASRWVERKTVFESLKHKQAVQAWVERGKETLESIREESSDTFAKLVSDLSRAKRLANLKGHFVHEPDLCVPVGTVTSGAGEKVFILYATIEQPAGVLMRMARGDAQKEALVREAAMSLYANKTFAAGNLRAAQANPYPWSLKMGRIPSTRELAKIGIFEADRVWEMGQGLLAPLLRDQAKRYQEARERNDKRTIRFAFDPDEALGLAVRPDYAPTKLFMVNCYQGNATHSDQGSFTGILTPADTDLSFEQVSALIVSAGRADGRTRQTTSSLTTSSYHTVAQAEAALADQATQKGLKEIRRVSPKESAQVVFFE